MARLIAAVLSDDDALKKQITRQLRDGRTPVSVADERSAATASADVLIVDGRVNLRMAIDEVQRCRIASASISIFLIASEANSDLIM